jgi:hypothetical protein
MNQMRIRRKMSSAKVKQNSVSYSKRETENLNDTDNPNDKINKSIYDHKESSLFTNAVVKVNSNLDNLIKKKKHSKRNKTVLDGFLNKSSVYQGIFDFGKVL